MSIQVLDQRSKPRNPLARRTDSEVQTPLLVKALGWLDSQSPTAVCAIGALIIFCIYKFGYKTGPHLSSSLFYLVPVLLITRVAGFKGGTVAALGATILWLYKDLNTPGAFEKTYAPYWNSVMRMGTWMIIVGLVSAMRSLTDHLEERVVERTSALEAQIAEKRELEESILEISDREQARIGQDLHDGLCQQLVSAAFSANMLKEKVADDFTPAIRDANRIADMIDDAITQARNLARGLYPVRLETEGLEMALRELAPTVGRRFNVNCVVDCPSPVPLCNPAVSIHLYRVAQEAAINSAKHSKADKIIISLKADDGRIHMAVEDNGVGFGDEASNPAGMGLSIMEYRARMIGAEFKIAAGKDGGIRVSCEISEDLFNS